MLLLPERCNFVIVIIVNLPSKKTIYNCDGSALGVNEEPKYSESPRLFVISTFRLVSYKGNSYRKWSKSESQGCMYIAYVNTESILCKLCNFKAYDAGYIFACLILICRR